MALEIKKISELDPAEAIDGSELIELEQNSNSVKEDLDTLAAYYLDFLDSYFDFGSDELTIFTDLICEGDLNVDGDLTVDGTITGVFAILNFDSGWLLNEMAGAGVADWTNVHMGNDPTDPTDNLTHNLDAPLSELIVKVLISTDGTDANSFEPRQGMYNYAAAASSGRGFTIDAVDNNNIIVQTGQLGFFYIDTAGEFVSIDTENGWYYKIKVWKLG